jgi:hypothetical protein
MKYLLQKLFQLFFDSKSIAKLVVILEDKNEMQSAIYVKKILL